MNTLSGWKTSLHRGFALVESLIVTSMLVFGFIASNRTEVSLIKNKQTSNQQNQAVQLANQKMEQLRHFTDQTGYSNIASGSDSTTGSNTTYSRVWTVTNFTGYKRVDQTVSWTNSDNVSQSISISSIINQNEPKSSGQLFNSPSNKTQMGSPAGGSSGSSGTGTGGTGGTGTTTGPTTDVTVPGTNIILTYDSNNNVVAINGGKAVTIAGSVSTDATDPSLESKKTDLSKVTVQTNNSLVATCSYSSTTFSFTCIMGSGWSGQILLGGVTDVKVCVVNQQPYSNVLTALSNQNYLLIKTTKDCPASYPFLLQTL